MKYISDVKIKNNELEIIYSNGSIVKEEANYENYKNALNEKSKSLENFDINGLIELISKIKKCKYVCLASAALTLIIPNFEILYFLIFIMGFTILHGFSSTMNETKENYFKALIEEQHSNFKEDVPLLTKQKYKVFTEAKDYEKAYLDTKELEEPKKEKSKVFIKTKK